LIDKNGYVRYRWDGELNWKSTRGEAIMRKKIEELIAEPGPKRTDPKKPTEPKKRVGPSERSESNRSKS